MMNQVFLVGRLVRTPEIYLTDSGKKRSQVTIAVPRSYKNQDGTYETDFVDCTLWTNIAENTAEYCKSGDVVGVRGRLQTRVVENQDGTKIKKVEVVADKVSFLSSSKSKKEDEENENDEKQEEIPEQEKKKKKDN